MPPSPPADISVRIGARARVDGDVCAELINMGVVVSVSGNVISPKTTGTALVFRHFDHVAGDVVTGGAAIAGAANVIVGGTVDTTGTHPALGSCALARSRADSQRTTFETLAASVMFPSPISVDSRGSSRIPAVGTLGSGVVVIDVPGINVGTFATLTLAGDSSTNEVIIRVSGNLRVRPWGRIQLEGLVPEQVLYLVSGATTVGAYGRLDGTVFSNSGSRLVARGTVNGALLGNAPIAVGATAAVKLRPFLGW